MQSHVYALFKIDLLWILIGDGVLSSTDHTDILEIIPNIPNQKLNRIRVAWNYGGRGTTGCLALFWFHVSRGLFASTALSSCALYAQWKYLGNGLVEYVYSQVHHGLTFHTFINFPRLLLRAITLPYYLLISGQLSRAGSTNQRLLIHIVSNHYILPNGPRHCPLQSLPSFLEPLFNQLTAPWYGFLRLEPLLL